MPERDRAHNLEIRVAALEIQLPQIMEKQDQLKEGMATNANKIDKLISRMTTIIAFLSGVLFISSETGGSFLRAIVGVLI